MALIDAVANSIHIPLVIIWRGIRYCDHGHNDSNRGPK
uniref:Uncharacterized protein n=1 Tax=Setaria italica TaxID=4555 RepID=K4ANZ5_SETIT